jgi:hypothetical protein
MLDEPLRVTPKERIDLITGGITPPDAIDYRQPVNPRLKAMIEQAFAEVPAGKRGALLVIADDLGTRAHLAAKIGDSWKVATTAGVSWQGEASVMVGLQGVW